MIRLYPEALPMVSIDLHCHSTASDGVLSPTDLVLRAASRGVQVLALTDHDDTAGLEEARAACADRGIRLVNGVEISVSWRQQTVHVVGLGIDPRVPALAQGLASVRAGREARARRIADALAKCGIRGGLEGAYAFAANPRLIGRTHFARFLVAQGHVKEMKDVFRKYLARGKPGYVSHQWASLAEAAGWIAAAGGVAVIAHPGRYPLSGAEFAELFSEFRDLGGGGIEVVTSSHNREQSLKFAREAQRFGLLASRGSDFHGPGESHCDLGALPELPPACLPLWQHRALH